MLIINKNRSLFVLIFSLILCCSFTLSVYATTGEVNNSKQENPNDEVDNNKQENNDEDLNNYDNELYTLFTHMNKKSNDRVETLDNYEYLYKYKIKKDESIYFFKNAYKVLDVEGFEVNKNLYKALVTLEFSSDSTIYQWVTMEKQKDGYYLISMEKTFEDFYKNKDSFDSEGVQYLIQISYDFNNLSKEKFIEKYLSARENDEYEINDEEINEKYNELKNLDFFSIYYDEKLEGLKDEYEGMKFNVYDKDNASISGSPFFYFIKRLDENDYFISFENESENYFETLGDGFLFVIGFVLAIPVIVLGVFISLDNRNSNSIPNSNSNFNSNNNRNIHETLNSSEINDLLDNESSKEDSVKNLLNSINNIPQNQDSNNNESELQSNELEQNNNRSIVFDKNENNEVKKLKDLTKTKRSIHFDDEE